MNSSTHKAPAKVIRHTNGQPVRVDSAKPKPAPSKEIRND